MRIGFIGTGEFASAHAGFLKELGCDLTACFDINADSAKYFSDTHGARIFGSADEVISKDHIDALYIVIPPFAHDGSVERKAISEGIPFHCEKPVGLNLDNCREVLTAVTEAKLVTSTGYWTRYGEVTEKIKNLISKHEIATVRACRFGRLPSSPWWRKMECSGGMMVEQATHEVDFARYIMGDITSLSAVYSNGISNQQENCDVYDAMHSQYVFKSGAIGSISICNVQNHAPMARSVLEAFGDSFTLTFDGRALRYKDGDEEWQEEPVVENQIKCMDETFLKAVAANDPDMVLSPYDEAVKTLEVTLAMNESAASGNTVTF